jgi:hypothetical protein
MQPLANALTPGIDPPRPTVPVQDQVWEAGSAEADEV